MSSRHDENRAASASLVKMANRSAATASHTIAPTASASTAGLDHVGREVGPRRRRARRARPRTARSRPRLVCTKPGHSTDTPIAERAQRTGQRLGEPVGGELRRDVGRGVPACRPTPRRSMRCSRCSRGPVRPWRARRRARPAPGPSTFTCRIRSHSLISTRCGGPSTAMPALFMTRSTAPNVSNAAAASASTSASLVTSQRTASARRPERLDRCRTVSASRSSWMSATTTSAPRRASSRAVARPIPLAPPVTTAVIPSTSTAREPTVSPARRRPSAIASRDVPARSVDRHRSAPGRRVADRRTSSTTPPTVAHGARDDPEHLHAHERRARPRRAASSRCPPPARATG